MADDAKKPKSPIKEAFESLQQVQGLSIAGLVFSVLATIVYGWGAAKLNWSVNQSWFWAILAFIFSPLYYPYYAFFQRPMGIFGAARRR